MSDVSIDKMPPTHTTQRDGRFPWVEEVIGFLEIHKEVRNLQIFEALSDVSIDKMSPIHTTQRMGDSVGGGSYWIS
ncbi:hypothetical protein CEXT_553851 [Caerostris extrusa]|uniref:Uncharacterized protein n=1 Tax=Caerostris extrusa TaxID=172846 RepID=A0AAV4SBN7_CAEEX|nr:hypothetical protein CEXT_553851 [Caerostris extrusa]